MTFDSMDVSLRVQGDDAMTTWVSPEPTHKSLRCTSGTEFRDSSDSVVYTRCDNQIPCSVHGGILERTVREWQSYIGAWADRKKWWDFTPSVKAAINIAKDAEEVWALIGGYQFQSKLALITSEISEALEEFRDGHSVTEVYYRTVVLDDGSTAQAPKPEGVPIELADAAIRLFDLAEHLGIDLGVEIARKMAYNETREVRHGGKLA